MFRSLSSAVLETNPAVTVKTDIVSDRSEPSVIIQLVSGKKFLFKTSNLNDLELFEVYNQYISSIAEPTK